MKYTIASHEGRILRWNWPDGSKKPVRRAFFVDASGGTITYDGDYKIHTFTSNGVFVSERNADVSVFVIAGGGGGGYISSTTGMVGRGGGGGAGGVSVLTMSVLANADYTMTIGTGGGAMTNGGNSYISTDSSLYYVIAYGGGGGGSNSQNGKAGGSGAGGNARQSTPTPVSSLGGASIAGSSTHYGNAGQDSPDITQAGFGGGVTNWGFGMEIYGKTYAKGGVRSGDRGREPNSGNGGGGNFIVNTTVLDYAQPGDDGTIIISYKYK